MTWQAHIERYDYDRKIRLHLANTLPPLVGVYYAEHLESLTYVRREEGDSSDGVNIPDQQMLQALVDACWRAGIRPEALQADASEIGATKRHLEDMRAIAFHKVGAERP